MSSMQVIRAEEYVELGDILRQVQHGQEMKRDYIVDTRRMGLTALGELRFDDGRGYERAGEVIDGIVLPHAHGQLSEYTKIPKRYYDRMQSEAPELLARNVNHWLHAADDRRMVRMMGDDVRAFLSDRYRRLDNYDLLEQAVLPTLATMPGLRFHVAALTDVRLTLRVVLETMTGEVTVGDVVQAGVEIRNSEVGAGRLSVAPFIWRLACLNGMVVNDLALSRYHVGRVAEEEAFALFTDETLAADDRAFFLKARDAINAALSETTFARIVGTLREAATGERVMNPVAATQLLAQRYELSEDEHGGLLARLVESGDFSQWGMANALTAAAKDAGEFERQRELEALGGALVAEPTGMWQVIATARSAA